MYWGKVIPALVLEEKGPVLFMTAGVKGSLPSLTSLLSKQNPNKVTGLARMRKG